MLAAGCAVYHQICSQPNPEKALKRLAASVDLDLARISDPCRVIVEFLIDYGGSKDEKTANRQYAARDARALSYIVRKGMDPLEVAKPAKGETLTKWADREAAYRSARRPTAKRAKKGPQPLFWPLKQPPASYPSLGRPRGFITPLQPYFSLGRGGGWPQSRRESLGLSRCPAEGPNRRPG